MFKVASLLLFVIPILGRTITPSAEVDKQEPISKPQQKPVNDPIVKIPNADKKDKEDIKLPITTDNSELDSLESMNSRLDELIKQGQDALNSPAPSLNSDEITEIREQEQNNYDEIKKQVSLNLIKRSEISELNFNDELNLGCFLLNNDTKIGFDVTVENKIKVNN
jgi:hypothetical protein